MGTFWLPDKTVHSTRRIDQLLDSLWSQRQAGKSDKLPLTIFIHPHILAIRNPQRYIDVF